MHIFPTPPPSASFNENHLVNTINLPCCAGGGTCPITPGCIALPWPKCGGGGYPGGRPCGAKNGCGG